MESRLNPDTEMDAVIENGEVSAVGQGSVKESVAAGRKKRSRIEGDIGFYFSSRVQQPSTFKSTLLPYGWGYP